MYVCVCTYIGYGSSAESGAFTASPHPAPPCMAYATRQTDPGSMLLLRGAGGSPRAGRLPERRARLCPCAHTRMCMHVHAHITHAHGGVPILAATPSWFLFSSWQHAQLVRGQTVLELGAGAGLASLAAAAAGAHSVIATDLPRALPLLIHNLELNGAVPIKTCARAAGGVCCPGGHALTLALTLTVALSPSPSPSRSPSPSPITLTLTITSRWACSQ